MQEQIPRKKIWGNNLLMIKRIYKIEGMHCASCAKNIEAAVEKILGVKKVNINFMAKKLYVEAEAVNDEKIIEAVSQAGDYRAISEKEEEKWEKKMREEKTTTFTIKGLDNPHCAMTIEKAVKKLSGVKSIDLNINAHKATINHSTEKEKIVQAINDAGYEILKEEEKEQDVEIIEMQKAKKRMWLSWLFAIPIAVIGLIFERLFELHNFFVMSLPLVLAFPILFVIGYPTLRSAVKSIKYFSFNMDVLISFGTIIAFLTGVLRFFMPIEDYSGIGGMIMAFFLTVRYF